MATLSQIVADIKNLLSGGGYVDDRVLHDRQIAFWVNKWRAYLIKDEVEKNNNVDESLYQDLGCVPLDKVDVADCPEVLYGYDVYKARLPALISNEPWAIGFVGLIDKRTPLRVLTESTIHRIHSWLAKNVPYALFIGGKLYITGCSSPRCYINVRAILSNPLDCAEPDGECSGKCLGWDEPYPIADWMLPLITQNILNEVSRFVYGLQDSIAENRDTLGKIRTK